MEKCPCCGYLTLDGDMWGEICPVCYWEIDVGDENIQSEVNNGLTLKQARENYQIYGACEKKMVPYVRKPKKRELLL